MREPRPALAAAVALAVSAAGCATGHKLAYRPDELRELVRRRVPDARPGDVVVPFQVGAEHVERARALLRETGSDVQRVRRLATALLAPGGFGLRYAAAVTASAEETLRRGEGNCLALASVFVGLARAVGLEAYYIDASTRVHATRQAGDGITVNEGHVTAMVRTSSGNVGLDFARRGPIEGYRVLDDVEALANFYNNRGYERLEQAEDEGREPDWRGVERDFRLAVSVLPGFARAWNNLGVAAARLGRTAEAARDYCAAVAADPRLAAPHSNLAALHLAAGKVPLAVAELEEAARLDPDSAHVRANLERARARDAMASRPAAQPTSCGRSAGSVSSNQ